MLNVCVWTTLGVYVVVFSKNLESVCNWDPHFSFLYVHLIYVLNLLTIPLEVLLSEMIMYSNYFNTVLEKAFQIRSF